ncbi:hypothetical protein ACMSDV_22160, partial [Bacteroides thetaiotaomicron]
MRKLSITLLLIALSFITMEANILSTHKSCRKRLISTHPKRGYPFTFHALYPNGDAKLVIIFYFRMVCHCF